MISLPAGSTDAALTPHHVDRGKKFIDVCLIVLLIIRSNPFCFNSCELTRLALQERFGSAVNLKGVLNLEQIKRNIELTRFPVPHDDDHKDTIGYPGLVRAADLLGQLSDPTIMRKYANLFYEFKETGSADKLGYKTIADLKAGYPTFFWKVVHPYVADASTAPFSFSLDDCFRPP